jgi:hypothetical protein
MVGFTNGLELLLLKRNESSISTGSPSLDKLIGGIRKGMFYLFYGEEELIEILFRYLLTNALSPTKNIDLPVVVYVLCGNYRKERTEIGTDELIELVETSGFGMEEALKRIYILTASSADQQSLLIDELLKILKREEKVVLVLVRGIFKLHYDDARIKNRHVVREEVQRAITHFSQLCASRGIPIVTSGRPHKRTMLLPKPESSSFLKHLANTIIYLRKRKDGSLYNRAFLLSHPAKSPGSTEYAFELNIKLGRDTPPFRQAFNELVLKLRREFQEALLRIERREAFDLLIGAWSAELGAMSFAESVKLLDLLLLVAAVENRSQCENLLKKIQVLDNRIASLENRYE